MGNLTGRPKWSQGIRHQTAERWDAQYSTEEFKQREAEANLRTYYVCRGYGKPSGYRGWQCHTRPVTWEETHAILERFNKMEQPVGRSARTWESPYLYTVVQAPREQVAYTLGEEPWWRV